MDQDKVVHQGYLQIPSQVKLVLKKSSLKYCLLYKQSKFGVDRLEVYDSIDNANKHTTSKIITLENCVKITTVPPCSFIVVMKNTQYEFSTSTVDELNEWVSAFQSVAFKDDVSKITTVEEDNELYCSTSEDVYLVKFSPSEAAKRCCLNQNRLYSLLLTSTAIQLYDDRTLLFTWPFRNIRRYGHRAGKFTFEAGRSCESGEGEFQIEYSNHRQIFQSLSTKMKSMKKILSGESTTSLLDCGDNQFQAALSMEARTRSPLPPSPTSSTRLHDIEIENSLQFSKRSSLTFNEINNEKQERGPLPKPRPSKPPRKNLPGSTSLMSLNSQFDSYDYTNYQSNKYDTVEYKKEAWKTLGIDEPNHSEIINEHDEDAPVEYSSWQKEDVEPPNKLNIISSLPIIDTKKAYDKLQFFGSTSKLSNPTPGYKQVSPVTPVKTNEVEFMTWNEYDEVEFNTQEVRPADDSHLGYAMIKKTTPKVTENPQIPHQVFNENVYAVVSKPKQV